MANFHEDHLVIAAREKDMSNVLKRIALNLAANQSVTGFDISRIDGLNSVRHLFHAISAFIDSDYMYAFTGAPLPAAIEEAQANGWKSPTSSAYGFETVAAALHAALMNSDLGEDVTLAITRPEGRGMSDTASVNLSRINDVWALSINYATAWRPNSEDIDDLFFGLPEGEYGVAFYDSDEYDDNETISVFSGIHHGADEMNNVDSINEIGTLQAETLKERNAAATDGYLLDLNGLDHIAAAYADRTWDEWPFEYYEEDYEDEDEWGDDEEEEDQDDPSDTRRIQTYGVFDRFEYDCASLSGDDAILLANDLLNIVPKLPVVLRLTSLNTEEAIASCLSLMPGDTVLLEIRWQENPSQPAILSASTLDGHIFSQEECVDYRLRLPYGVSPAHLACLLPHVRATVWKVGKPRKSGDARNAKTEIRLELEETDVTTIPACAQALINVDRTQRVAASIRTEEH